MKKYVYAEAKKLIQSICQAAESGEYDSREKFYSMLKANPDIAAQGYNAYGKIFFWNKASAHIYGYSEAAAVNKDLIEMILPPEMRQFARDMIEMARKTGKMPTAGPCDLLQRNGDYVTVFSSHHIFHWENGSTPEFYCVDVAIAPQTD